ncbi:MAG: alpha/beta hydrolase [Spirochaetia bacterium]|nr:alpha/beta hydrolase [Spirochaetia bacterium]
MMSKPATMLLAILLLPATGLFAQNAARTFNTNLVSLDKDIEYGKLGSRSLKLDLYRPKTDVKKLPVVLMIYGTLWTLGKKEDLASFAYLIASQGFAVVVPEYRLAGEAVFPAQIQDLKGAIRFLRAKERDYKLDSEKIGAFGISTGGHLAALLGTASEVREFDGKTGFDNQPSSISCVVDCSGSVDFLKMEEQLAKNNLPVRNGQVRRFNESAPEVKAFGGKISGAEKLIKAMNPITYLDKEDPPFLIFHGDKDPIVPVQQSELCEAALRKVGVSVNFIRMKDHAHAPPGREELTTMIYFLSQHLQN